MSLSQPACCKVRESHLLTAGLIQLMAHEHKLLLHGSASEWWERPLLSYHCRDRHVAHCTWKKSPRMPKLCFLHPAAKGTLVQGVLTYSLYFKKNRAGTKPHSMLNIISNLNHGLNIVLLEECNKYLFWGNGNVSRRLKCKKIVWDFFFFLLVPLSFSFRVS